MRVTSVLLSLAVVLWHVDSGAAQTVTSDSLTIDQAVQLTIEHHAAIRQAEFDWMASEARVAVNRSDRYPNISFGADYTRIGPVSQFDLPGQGSIEVAPRNNYDLSLGMKQTLYDFGRTDNAIRLAETSQQTSADRIDFVKFDLAYQTIEVCNNILILHRQIDVLDEQLETLQRHREMSVERMKAGTATDFDTLTIQVRIAVVESNRIDAARALETGEIRLRELTGLPSGVPINLRGSFASHPLDLQEDSLVTAALNGRPEVRLARDAEATAVARLQLESLGDKPRLALNLATGFKNGYEPNLNTWRGNYAIGLVLNVPVFDGYQTEHREAAAEADLNAARAHTSDIEQRIRAQIRQAVAGVNSSLEKIKSTETQVYQAEKAVSLASVRYAAGVITNLDLLDAETTLSQAKLVHLRALYSFTVSFMQLNKAVGKKTW